MPTYPTRTLSTSIERDVRDVYDFLANPENFPKWASGLGRLTGREGDAWRVETPEGSALVRFTERNTFGIADHHVTLDTGVEIYVPVRAIANGSGTEVVITVYRRPGVSDTEFDADAQYVNRDLKTLKAVLEE